MGQFFAYDNGFNMHRMIREHGESYVKEFLENLTPEEAMLLYDDPYFTLREKQIIEEDGRFGTMALLGRGAGKTYQASVWINIRAYMNKGPILLVGQNAADTRDIMVEGNPSSIIEVCPDWFKPKYEPSKRLLTWPNGILGFCRAGDSVEGLRGQNSQTVWCDEMAKWDNLDEAWSNIIFGLRQGNDPQFLVTTTPRPKPLIKQLFEDPKCVTITGSTMENAANLSPKALEEMIRLYDGTKLGRQELHGELLWEDERALWKPGQIEENRKQCPQTVAKIIIGVDPSTSTGKKRNDECGIVVSAAAEIAGVDHAFVLADYSLKGSPEAWAKRVFEITELYPRATIVAESNQGGEMVRMVLEKYGVPKHKIKLKHHLRSKFDRAVPVSMLAEQGLIHHTQTFTILEDEMVSYTGEPGEKSPNRLDAAVISLHALLIEKRSRIQSSSLGV